MPQTRLPAKLSRPRLFGVIERDRLFALLDAQRGRPLVWVTGPPGAGKTTLVTTYLARARAAALWYRIDEGDADAATFFSYLGQAAAALTRKRALHLPLLSPQYLLDLPGFARRYFQALFAAVPALDALVIDGYEIVSGGVLDALLNIAVDEAPEGVRILVTSREPPPPALGYLVGRGALALVPWSELRLSVPEALAIAGSGRSASAGSIESLHALSDGWAAGFVVLLDHGKQDGLAYTQSAGALRETLFAYFVHEMFGRIGDATRNLLMRTALMSSFTAEQAAALCANDEAGRLLTGLYRRHYFVDRTDSAEPVYRYHALFRDFLLQQGRALLGSPDRATLLVQAAALHRDAGQAEDAITLLTEARSWGDLASLVCQLAPDWMRQGRNTTLDKAVSAMPRDVVDKTAWLSFWLGMARLPFAPAAGRASLEAAFAQFDAAGDTAASMLACCGILNSFFLEWNDMNPVDRWGASFQALAARQEAFPTVEMEIQALSSLSVLVFRASRHGRFLASCCNRALELMAMTSDPLLRLVAANFAGAYLLFAGSWRRIRQLSAEVDKTLDLSVLPPVHVISWLVLQAAWLGQQGEFEKSFETSERSRALAQASGVRILDVLIAAHITYPALNCGDMARAESSLASMRAALHPARTMDALHCEFIDSAFAMARDDWLLVRSIARSGIEQGAAIGADIVGAQSRIALALAHAELGEYAAATDETDCLVEYAQASGQRTFQYAGLMLKAYTLLRVGEMSKAGAALRDGFAMGREEEYVVIFPHLPVRVLQTLCSAALEAGIEVAYVTSVIRRLDVLPANGTLEHWPWRVKIHTLGRFAVFRDDQPLLFSGKAQRKPMELLKALIGFGASKVPVDTLIQSLWPEPHEGDGQTVFDITLHRLRKLLGADAAIALSDRRVSLNPALVWLDTRSLAHLLERLAAPPANGVVESPAHGVALEQVAAKLLDLYRGDFLSGEPDSAWTLATRGRLATQFRQYLLRLGAHFENTARWADAGRLYERGVELEPLAEALYRQWMACLLRQGRHAEVIEVFRRCRGMLSVVLGVKPSRETEDVYRAALVAGRL